MAFPSTHWTVLASATLHGSRVASEALGEFYLRYREPVRRFFLLRGVAPGEVEDVVQSFFLHAMERSLLRRAEPGQGRFRAWLCGAAVRFLAHRRGHGNAQKRGGGFPDLSLDAGEAAEVATEDDQRKFDRDWAVRILELALERVQQDYAGDPEKFALLRGFLPGAPGASGPEGGTAGSSAANSSTFRSEVHRLRIRFRSCLRAEVALTTASPHEVDAEMAWLREVLSSRTGPVPATASAAIA